MAAERQGRARLVGQAVLVAAIYVVVGTLSLRLARDTGLAAPIWPAAGVAFVFAFQRGWGVLPGIAVGSLLVNLPALLRDGSASAVAVSTAIAVGAALQAQVGAVAVRRLVGPRPALDEARQIVVFMALAGPLACLVAPTIGVAAQLLGGVIRADQALNVWLTWWVGDSIGVVVFAPLTLMLLPEQADIWRGRRLRVAIPSLLISAGTVGVFLLNATLAQRQVDLQLDQRATAAAERLTSNLDRQSAVLEGVRSLFNASDDVTRGDFTAFTRGTLSRDDGLQALAWSALVTSARLADFVRQQEGPTLDELHPLRTRGGRFVDAARRPPRLHPGAVHRADRHQQGRPRVRPEVRPRAQRRHHAGDRHRARSWPRLPSRWCRRRPRSRASSPSSPSTTRATCPLRSPSGVPT